MSLKIDHKVPGLTVKNADVRIEYFTVNKAEPFVLERAPSTFETFKRTRVEMVDGKEEEVEYEIEEETLGEVTKSEKRYSVNLFLEYQSEDREGIYARQVVSIDGLKEKELTFPTFYKKLKLCEGFTEAVDVD